MIVTIHQPDFLPWLGFFDRWMKSDCYIVLDDVQFIRRGWQHRDKIKTASGAKWLTIPVKKKGNYTQLISEVRLEDGSSWKDKHLKTIKASYSKAPFFDKHYSELEQLYRQKTTFLLEFNLLFLEYVATALAITTPMTMASSFQCTDLRSTERLVELTRRCGGTNYLTGTGSRAYLEQHLFHEQGIEVTWSDYVPTPYTQLHGPFEPGISVIDYLMMTDGTAREIET